jgi:hypothetical protein
VCGDSENSAKKIAACASQQISLHHFTMQQPQDTLWDSRLHARNPAFCILIAKIFLLTARAIIARFLAREENFVEKLRRDEEFLPAPSMNERAIADMHNFFAVAVRFVTALRERLGSAL